MTDLLNRKRLMMVICLVATLALAACGDDNGGNNGAGNNGGGNNGADAGDQDTGDQDTGDEDTGDQDTGDQDTGDQDTGDQDTGGGACDVNGFTAPTDMLMEESGTSWTLYGETDTQFVRLTLLKDGGATGTGQVEFEDVAISEATNVLVMGNGCTDQGCEAIFMATSGTLDITTFETEVDEGSFEASLSDIELVEIEQTQEGGVQKVQDGQNWCITDASLAGTVDLMVPYPDTVSCDTEEFTDAEGTESATVFDSGVFVVESANSDTTPQDFLSLQIYPSIDGAAITAGQYELDDFNFATCANCLLVYAGCDDQDVCEKTYIAGAGTPDITSAGTVNDAFTAGEQFTATLTGAELVEVTIDSNYETSIVEDGAGWCIGSYSWDLAIEAPASP